MDKVEQSALDFREKEMSRYQMFTVGLCLIINMLDGFDVLAIAFTAPSIAVAWDLHPTELGILFSAGPLGMTVGSLVIGPLADYYGRRPLILACLVTISIGMLLSALTTTTLQLSILRVLTGLGIGGMLASLNTLVSEYSSYKRQAFCISIFQSGYPIGASVGGVIATYLIAMYDWRAVFIFGGVLSTLMIVVAWFYLFESIDYLRAKNTNKALAQLQSILRRMGSATNNIPPKSLMGKTEITFNYRALFEKEYFSSTARIWLSYFGAMFAFYFIINWTPKIIVDMGLSVDQGITSGVIMNVGGMIGGLFLGYIAVRWDIRVIVAAYFVASFFVMSLFGFLGPHYVTLLIVAFFIGIFLFGGIVGLYAVIPQIYHADVRAFGTGWGIGMGRLGGIVGPFVAGLIISSGIDRHYYFLILAIPVLLVALAIYNIELIRNRGTL